MRRLFSRWDDIHVWFRYRGVRCVVWEPYGDNSRYTIVPQDSSTAIDMAEVETVFREHGELRAVLPGLDRVLQFLRRRRE